MLLLLLWHIHLLTGAAVECAGESGDRGESPTSTSSYLQKKISHQPLQKLLNGVCLCVGVQAMQRLMVLVQGGQLPVGAAVIADEKARLAEAGLLTRPTGSASHVNIMFQLFRVVCC